MISQEVGLSPSVNIIHTNNVLATLVQLTSPFCEPLHSHLPRSCRHLSSSLPLPANSRRIIDPLPRRNNPSTLARNWIIKSAYHPHQIQIKPHKSNQLISARLVTCHSQTCPHSNQPTRAFILNLFFFDIIIYFT